MEKELADARAAGREELIAEIRARFSYRMHNLSEFMKTLLQRFTRWRFSRRPDWERRLKGRISRRE